MDTLKWLLATGNPGKVRELRRLLTGYPIEIAGLESAGLPADCPESGDSFLENAKQKAGFYHLQSGMVTLADDSGLEVDYLDGRPGIYSARFGGLATHREKIDYLLSLMEGVEPPLRTARFCCAAVYFDGTTYHTSQATLEGFIRMAPEGDGGFGYDPIFSPTWAGATMAEIDLDLKNTLSHRGKAFTQLLEHLQKEGILTGAKSS